MARGDVLRARTRARIEAAGIPVGSDDPTLIAMGAPPLNVFTPSIPNPPDLKAESPERKARRLLKTLRQFAADEAHLSGIEIDGVKIMLVKFDPTRHLFELNPEVTA